MPDVVWQCEAVGKTFEQAVDDFVGTYWEKPRPRTGLKYDGKGGYLFSLSDGVRIYRCTLSDGEHPHVYRIELY